MYKYQFSFNWIYFGDPDLFLTFCGMIQTIYQNHFLLWQTTFLLIIHIFISLQINTYSLYLLICLKMLIFLLPNHVSVYYNMLFVQHIKIFFMNKYVYIFVFVQLYIIIIIIESSNLLIFSTSSKVKTKPIK
jgi:hypothetical protein